MLDDLTRDKILSSIKFRKFFRSLLYNLIEFSIFGIAVAMMAYLTAVSMNNAFFSVFAVSVSIYILWGVIKYLLQRLGRGYEVLTFVLGKTDYKVTVLINCLSIPEKVVCILPDESAGKYEYLMGYRTLNQVINIFHTIRAKHNGQPMDLHTRFTFSMNPEGMKQLFESGRLDFDCKRYEKEVIEKAMASVSCLENEYESYVEVKTELASAINEKKDSFNSDGIELIGFDVESIIIVD